jgi:hypothetical protein
MKDYGRHPYLSSFCVARHPYFLRASNAVPLLRCFWPPSHPAIKTPRQYLSTQGKFPSSDTILSGAGPVTISNRCPPRYPLACGGSGGGGAIGVGVDLWELCCNHH